jgi:predicted amidohydrolase YtcJ
VLIRSAEVETFGDLDVRISDGVVTRIGRPGERLVRERHEPEIDAAGGALLPGLHDHHVHLMAVAAAGASVRLGPPDVVDRAAFATRLRAAADRAAASQSARGARPASASGPGRGSGWVRGIGYHPSVAGDLDRFALDVIVPDAPVRIQHRGGALWVLNSAALRRIDAEGCDLPGVERTADGSPTGRLWRLDDWLSTVVPPVPVDLAAVGRAAAAAGVTGFTDATPARRASDAAALIAAVRSGALPQRLTLMGPVPFPEATPRPAPEPAAEATSGSAAGSGPRLGLGAEAGAGVGSDGGTRWRPGPHKIMLDDVSLPAPSDLAGRIGAAHRAGVPVAVHCVTRVQLVVALAAFTEARADAANSRDGGRPGVSTGDRIEHGAVVPAELTGTIRALGLTVVTQPNFVAERGERYLAEVDADDLDCLYPCASLLAAGIDVAAGTDAPFGDPDPWRGVRAAIDRRTAAGRELLPRERVTPRTALGLYLGPAHRPGRPRRIRVGLPADLCLLRAPLDEALLAPGTDQVAMTIIGGTVIHDASPSAR